jgi:hypothetical protein
MKLHGRKSYEFKVRIDSLLHPENLPMSYDSRSHNTLFGRGGGYSGPCRSQYGNHWISSILNKSPVFGTSALPSYEWLIKAFRFV